MRLPKLKISILPLNSTTMGDFHPNFCIFWKKIFQQEQNFPTGNNLGAGRGVIDPPAFPATTLLMVV